MLDATREVLARPRTTAQSVALASAVLGCAALAGSGLFGLVHVVGGAIRGNPRALWFGVWLTLVSVVLLAALALAARRFLLARPIESE